METHALFESYSRLAFNHSAEYVKAKATPDSMDSQFRMQFNAKRIAALGQELEQLMTNDAAYLAWAYETYVEQQWNEMENANNPQEPY